MKIGIHDADAEHLSRHRGHKPFPNYALMKISAYHKSLGDTVEWFSPLERYDKVYSSKVFDFTPENPYLPPDTIKGGTGYGMFADLPDEIDEMFPDYSIYPDCDYAIGYITRGCPNNCPWCYVPRKEGGIKPYRGWEQLVRPGTDKLVLMDNNILACEYGIEQLESLAGSGYRIDLNQGMDIRLVRLTFLDNGSPAYRFKDCVYKNEIARKLYAYEDTGLTPEEIIAMKADNKRLHELIDILEGAIKAL